MGSRNTNRPEHASTTRVSPCFTVFHLTRPNGFTWTPAAVLWGSPAAVCSASSRRMSSLRIFSSSCGERGVRENVKDGGEVKTCRRKSTKIELENVEALRREKF